MRRLLIISVCLGALASAATAVAGAPVFVITGKGWGHGIGMSQWGAQGYAVTGGKSYDWILRHYYSGTSVEEDHGRTVTVLLASGRSSVSIGSRENFTATSAGKTYVLEGRTHTLGPRLVVTDVNGKRHDLVSPVTFAGTAPLRLGGDPYRGTLVVRSNGSTMAVANRLSLDSYVKGVVPREMPASWHPEALKVQAVAARSYALASGGHCSFGGYPVFCATTWDQVYGGIGAEDTRSNTAVDQTAGEAVVYGGQVAQTFFFSTSGGKTANVQDEWGSSVPYLVSVEDAYDSISPHHNWGPRDAEIDCPGTSRDCVFTAAQLRSWLGSRLPSSLRDITVTRNSSSRVDHVTATGASARTISGGTMRSQLGLRSTWFSVGVLSLTPAETRVVFGAPVRLTGLARGVGTAYLERRPYGGTWARMREVAPDSGGAWSTNVTPWRTTSYRVVAGGVTGTASRVLVAVRVGFHEPANGQLRGVIGPKRAGASVAIQKRRVDGTWKTLATVSTNADGEFAANVGLSAGTYRAVARLGGGYVAGYAYLRVT